MSKESWRPVTSHLPWARFRTAVPVFVGLSGLAMLGIRVYYLVVHGMNGFDLFIALLLVAFTLSAFRLSVAGLSRGPAGLRWRSMTKTRYFAWNEIAGFELRSRKWRGVTVSGITFVTTAGEAINTEVIVGPNDPQPSVGLYSAEEVEDLLAELEAQRAVETRS
ncbi:hypothetical protein [Amycolatopsis magusensis]|uniref:hypothetical protein n=1 Tax=Amycolatopsis magusensis TaxID=882444 RepID=UPI0024A8ABFC|nr:hypothetical protein [Amycolatopsis magusensis]MDI5979993.1 hypothetical protein [Amycolatopsis magusensis]